MLEIEESELLQFDLIAEVDDLGGYRCLLLVGREGTGTSAVKIRFCPRGLRLNAHFRRVQVGKLAKAVASDDPA